MTTKFPFKPSSSIKGLTFTGRYHVYTEADTWYPSWASDGRMFSPFTDGTVNGRDVMSFNREGKAPAQIGHAVIHGDWPHALTVSEDGAIPVTIDKVYSGRYPSANLYHDGIWYIGTYGLASAYYTGYNWPILGPFCGFHISHDDGKTWTPSPWNPEAGNSMFGEPAVARGPVKLGALHVVDFGRNMEHSPDGKMYLIGHGSDIPDQTHRKASNSWITGDHIYLCRVSPRVDAVNDPLAYEFFAGHDASGAARWSSRFEDIRPVLDWPGHTGCVTATYHPTLNKYLMVFTDGRETVAEMDSYVLEADALTGPYRLVWSQRDFGPQAYFLNFPSRFLSVDGKTGWLCLSANFCLPDRLNPLKGNPEGSCYRLCLLECAFDVPADDQRKKATAS